MPSAGPTLAGHMQRRRQRAGELDPCRIGVRGNQVQQLTKLLIVTDLDTQFGAAERPWQLALQPVGQRPGGPEIGPGAGIAQRQGRILGQQPGLVEALTSRRDDGQGALRQTGEGDPPVLVALGMDAPQNLSQPELQPLAIIQQGVVAQIPLHPVFGAPMPGMAAGEPPGGVEAVRCLLGQLPCQDLGHALMQDDFAGAARRHQGAEPE